MTKIKLNGKKIAAAVIMLLIYVAVLIYCNNIDKTELIATEGQTYEKATVTEIIMITFRRTEIVMEIRRLC